MKKKIILIIGVFAAAALLAIAQYTQRRSRTKRREKIR